jgi:oxygen-independent coproporphyrinogen-3 oxidase
MALVDETSQAIADREEIDQAKAASELMFLGLRMTEGIPTDAFRAGFGRNPAEHFPQIADWLEAGLMEETSGYLRLTHRGMMVANSIFVHFM